MCIDPSRGSALPASNIPSMQAANAVVLGGDNGANSGLGRLKLREPSSTTTAPAPTTTPLASSVAGLAPASSQASAAQATPGNIFAPSVNPGLRIPMKPA